jgi:hypothetical protein
MTLTTQNNQLPTKFEDVAQFAVLAQEKLKSVKAEINAIKRLGLARDVYEQKKAEAQELAELTVRAEVKLGEITSNMPTAQGARTDLTSLPQGKEVVTKQAALKGANINAKRASHYEAMAAHPEIVEAAITEARENDDIVSRSFVLEKIKAKEKAAQIAQAKESIASQTKQTDSRPVIHITDSRTFNVGEKYDLLLTDPPYSTDVPDLEVFIDSWLYKALDGVKNTGFAYVFIGAYPNELKAYLNAEIPDHLTLEQVLVWTYKNTLGNNPKDRYKQNYQACLFFRGINASSLDCPLTTEQWAVQEINAPDGRQGDRYHAWQKPMEIAERFIRHTTKQGDLVYDPFACTGTFILAASKLGRRGIGCEIDGDNAQIAMNRGCAVWRETSGNP